jgi:hypothetical protein
MQNKCILLILAIFVIYFIGVNNQGYVIDVTRFNPGRDNYNSYNINSLDIPQDVLMGYYKFVDGQFVLDEIKKAQWEADNLNPETPEEQQ